MEDSKQPCCCENLTCSSEVSQCADVNLPVSVKPYAIMGEPQTRCCGEPVITMHMCQNGCGCELTITQTICIAVPVEYGATACAGDISVCCKRNPPFFGC